MLAGGWPRGAGVSPWLATGPGKDGCGGGQASLCMAFLLACAGHSWSQEAEWGPGMPPQSVWWDGYPSPGFGRKKGGNQACLRLTK